MCVTGEGVGCGWVLVCYGKPCTALCWVCGECECRVVSASMICLLRQAATRSQRMNLDTVTSQLLEFAWLMMAWLKCRASVFAHSTAAAVPWLRTTFSH